MLRFLIFLAAFSMAAVPVPAAETPTPTPDYQAEIDASVKDIKALAPEIEGMGPKIKAEILKNVASSLKDTREEMRERVREQGLALATPSDTPTKIVKIHHSSNDEDMVFAAIPIVAIVFTFLYLIVRALMAPFTNRNKRMAPSFLPGTGNGLTEEEAALMEKLQRTITQMESRVESLETILIDQARNKEKYGTKL